MSMKCQVLKHELLKTLKECYQQGKLWHVISLCHAINKVIQLKNIYISYLGLCYAKH